MGNLIRLLMMTLLLAGCARNLPRQLAAGHSPGDENPFGLPKFISGSFVTTENQTILVNDQIAKPLVMIFSQDTCVVCRAESKMLAEKFQQLGGPPKNVDLATILVGAILEDAQEFKDQLGVSWTIGVQSGDPFFRRYCPEFKVPCVIVQKPVDGFVYQHTGEFQIGEIEKHTGPWLY